MTTENAEFDVNSFMNESMDTPELDLAIIPVPEGEHLGQIGTGDKDVLPKIGSKNGKPWMMLEVRIMLTDPNMATLLQRENPSVRYSFFIDLDEQGKPDFRPQRNVNLGKLRDAVGQNKAGPWSFSMLKGQPVKVKTKQKKADSGDTYSEVVAVTKAS